MNENEKLNILKYTFENLKDELVNENNNNSTKLTNLRKELARLQMVSYREGAIDILKSCIELVDNLKNT